MIIHTFCAFCNIEMKIVINKEHIEDVAYCPICKQTLDENETSTEEDEDD